MAHANHDQPDEIGALAHARGLVAADSDVHMRQFFEQRVAWLQDNGFLTAQPAPVRRGLSGVHPAWLAVAGVVALGLFGFKSQIFGSGPPDHSSSVATSIGASSCSSSGYYVQNRLDGHKSTIYNCTMSSGSTKCVTEDGGIASDATEEVKLLFENTLDGQKPDCIA